MAIVEKIIAAIKEPNQLTSLKKLKAIIAGSPNFDFTAVHGHSLEIRIDETLSFQTVLYTPVLLALALNKLDVARYFLEEVGVSLTLYLYKPRDQEEAQIINHIRKHPDDRREYRSLKKKQERYNRILALIMACKHENSTMLSYLLGSTTSDMSNANAVY